MNYQPIIGLEVHVELSTRSKMFCGCIADYFGHEPNTHTCPVCLGLPGALPVPNKKAIEWTKLLGLALGCGVNEDSKFDRKNYFYPDLSKGYQISQYDQPLCHGGKLTVKDATGNSKDIRIRRVHIEEDTGKLIHADVEGVRAALVDFNRSGVPLVEIVTEPDFRTVDEVDQYVKKLQQIVRYLKISTGDMEKGVMRLEPSISLVSSSDLSKDSLPSYRVELKNINSFRFSRKALEYEIDRQAALLEKGEKPTQQTRGWNEGKNATIVQREKEEAHDYRYFPEPDIPPMHFTKPMIEELKKTLPELPDVKQLRFMREYGLNDYDANQLVDTRERADYFEEAVTVSRSLKQPPTPKTIANWLINKKIDIDTLLPAQLIQQINDVSQVSNISEEELEKIITQVLSENPKAVEDYKNGKQSALMFLVGKIMQFTKGRIRAENLQQIIINKI